MIKLKKVNATQWNGNGMGHDPADWVVKGAEHIAVRKLGFRWWAIDTTKPKGESRIAWGDTKAQLIEKLNARAA
jgi:hypothetical protein